MNDLKAQPAVMWVLAAVLAAGFGGQAVLGPEQIGQEVTRQLTGPVMAQVADQVTQRVTANVQEQLRPVVARVETIGLELEAVKAAQAATKIADDARAAAYNQSAEDWRKMYAAEKLILEELARAIPELTAAIRNSGRTPGHGIQRPAE